MSEIDEKISTSGVIFGALIVQAGAKGDTGPQGEQGIQGIPGETGKDGKDYILTDSDKQEIANNIKKSIQSTLDALSNKDASQDVEITDIKTENNKQDARLDILEADNTTNKEDISNLQQDNTTNKSDIKSLQDDNETNKTDIQDIKQEQITQNTNIQELQTDNTSNKAKIESLETKNTEQDTNIQKNTEDIAEINEKNIAQDEEIELLKTKNTEQDTSIQTNTESIEQIKSKDTAQDSLIEQLQTKVVNLELENTSLKNQIPSGEATGNPIHLEDSSDMECEIVPIGGAEQETREGYNLLKLDFDKHKDYVTINGDGSFDVKNTSNGNIYPTIQNISLQAGTYTFLYEKNSNTPGIFIQRNNDGAYNFYLNSDTKYKQFTFDEDGVFRFEMLVGAGEEIKNVKLMLLKGAYTFDNQPTFEPYGAMPSPDYPSGIVTVGQNGSVEISVDNGLETTDTNYQSYTKILPIQKEFVKIGDVEDTFVKVDGKWYEAHYHPKIVFDGTENFEIATSSVTNISAFLLSNKITDNSTTNLRAYCNRFTVYANENWHQMPNNSIILGRDTRHQVLIRYDDITTVDDFKAKLANWYEAGQPLTGYYILATPELIECTAEQEEILNSFYTYKGITNISADGIATLKVNYKKDLETIINKLSATSVAE